MIDKAKAYDEALERARKQRDDYQKELDKTDKNSQLANILRGGISAVEMIFPQLKESNDEKIRKDIIDHFESIKSQALYDNQEESDNIISSCNEKIAYLKKLKECAVDNSKTSTNDDEKIRQAIIKSIEEDSSVYEQEVSKEQMLAYLEKQKEPLPIPDKFSGLKSLMLQYFQSAVHRNDDTEIESDTDLFGRKILGYVWKYSDEQKDNKFAPRVLPCSAAWFEDGEEKQKEQKVDIDKLRRDLYQSGYNDGYQHGKEDAQKEQKPSIVEKLREISTPADEDWFEIQKQWEKEDEQKPTWSEEDEEIIYSLRSFLILAEQSGRYGSIQIAQIERCLNWLKALRLQKLDASKLENFDPVDVLNRIKIEWPMAWEKVVGKQEWSEEDEKDIAHIIKILDDCYAFGRHDLSKTDHENLVNKLKSFHPSWKSSKKYRPAESISDLIIQGKGVYKICPRCKERMVRDDSMVYTSMPPQYRYECPKCGESECDTVMYDNPETEEQKLIEWRHYIWTINLRFDFTALIKYDNTDNYEIVQAGNRPKQEKNGVYILIKDIKPQYSWKPSKEQMDALKNVAYGAYQNGDGPALRELYEQLLKLGVKEEPEYYQHFDPDC